MKMDNLRRYEYATLHFKTREDMSKWVLDNLDAWRAGIPAEAHGKFPYLCIWFGVATDDAIAELLLRICRDRAGGTIRYVRISESHPVWFSGDEEEDQQ